MTKRVAIHQVNYVPWLGYFNKISQVDCFVLLDTAEYTKNNGVTNRTRIKDSHGSVFLTIPIEHKYFGTPCDAVMLPNRNDWLKKHWKSISVSYAKAPYFKSYSDLFKKTFESSHTKLAEFNQEFIQNLCVEFKLSAELVNSSDLDIDLSLKKTDMLLDVLNRVKATSYLSGQGGKSYLQEEKFQKIKLEYQSFKHPIYKQINGSFISGMSVMDLLFNEGSNAERIIKGK